jgi:hypothetical protein
MRMGLIDARVPIKSMDFVKQTELDKERFAPASQPCAACIAPWPDHLLLAEGVPALTASSVDRSHILPRQTFDPKDAPFLMGDVLPDSALL